MKTYVKTGEKIKIDSYPYGRLRCTAFFSVEFSPKHGFRTVFQTINPKNGRLNAPKKGTYAPMIAAYLNQDNGHAEFDFFSMYNKEDGLRFLSFFADHADLFTDDQQKHLKIYALAQIKCEASGVVRYCKVPVTEAILIVKPVTTALVASIKEKTDVKGLVPLFEQMYADLEIAREKYKLETCKFAAR